MISLAEMVCYGNIVIYCNTILNSPPMVMHDTQYCTEHYFSPEASNSRGESLKWRCASDPSQHSGTKYPAGKF